MSRLSNKSGKNTGYTLIETLVSGVLLVFAVTAAVAVVGTGTQLGTSDNYRRQARTILRSQIEQSYDYRAFAQIPQSETATETVTIDARQGVPLTGTMTRRILTDSVLTNSGTSCIVRCIQLTLRWSYADGLHDSISLSKMVANTQ